MASGNCKPAVSPGHFMLPLTINKDINIEKAAVEKKIRDLEHFRRVRVGRSEELAILNLQGLLTLRIHYYKEALEFFYIVLEKDLKNLNALANLQYVLEKLFRLTEAQHCKDEIHRLLKSQEPTAFPKTSDLGPSQDCLKARCLAEHAFAFTFDVYDETVECKRFVESNKLYRMALDLGGNEVAIAEENDWKFCIAVNAGKLFYSMWHKNELDDAQKYADTAIELFHDLTQIEDDPELTWDSWKNLGEIFNKFKRKKIIKRVPFGLNFFWHDPENCMLKAMEVSPNNARLLAHYANYLYFSDHEFTKSQELLEQSIRLDSSEFNFYAFSTRAFINIVYYMYQQQLRQMERDLAQSGLLRHIQFAKSDLETAISMHVTPWDLARLGQVYHLLAKHHTEEDTEVRSLIETALLYFTEAAECQDGHRRSDVNNLRGCCLFDIGEKRSAIGCFKQAIDCEAPTSKNTTFFNELFHVYLSILHEEKPNKDESILAEAAYSLSKAFVKYENDNLIKCITKFRSEYAKELAVLEEYCTVVSEFKHLTPLLKSVKTVRVFYARGSILAGGKLQDAWAKTYRLKKAMQEHHIKDADDRDVETRHTMVGAEGIRDKASGFDSDATSVQRAAGNEAEGVRVQVLTEQLANISMKKLIRKAPEEARVPDYLYDFCVVYSKSQTDWVSYDLLNELEAIYKLKGFTRDRDALAGTLKLTSAIELMKESASILLIITAEFENDRECEELMHHALQLRKAGDHTRVIIPIRRGNSEVPYEISTFNDFDATGAVDWSKLALCIEQQI